VPTIPDLLHEAHWRRRWRVLLAALVLAIALLAFTPGEVPMPTLGQDKLNHATAFAALSAVGLLSRRATASPVRVAVAALLYGVLIELVQSRIPGRSAELADLLADTVGIVLGLALVRALRRCFAPTV
jgi:VanZ family protein